jgi:hypothetical protein
MFLDITSLTIEHSSPEPDQDEDPTNPCLHAFYHIVVLNALTQSMGSSPAG